MNFRDRVVLVTGASKGIGLASAKLFAELGAAVAVHYRSDAAAARGLADQLRARGGRAETFAADLGRWDAAAHLVSDVEARLGALDVMVVNHGIWKRAPIETMREADYEEMQGANLRGVFALCGAAARAMRASGGHGKSIVLVSSTAGQRGEAEHAHYAATKGAIISLTKSLASELAPAGIRVNCVAPGWVSTPMTAAALSGPDRPKILAAMPFGRVAEPAEIAGPIAFLASEHASFVTGEILNVNGGAVLCG